MKKYNVIDNYYTTDFDIIRELKKCKAIECVADILATLSLISFAAIFVFMFVHINPLISISSCVLTGIISIAVAFFISTKADSMRMKVLDKYFETDEYKKQHKRHIRKLKQKEDKIEYKKAKHIIEIYDLLNSTKYSKQEKIKMLKNYIHQGIIK